MPRVEVECTWCGDKIMKEEHNIEDVDNVFCSHRHQGLWKSENKSGPDNPQWQGGGQDSYGPNWEDQRSKTLKRDGESCIRCGKEGEHISTMHVHHIIPFRTFDDYREANRLENLATLCSRCHGIVENWPVYLDRLRENGGVSGD